MSEQGFRLLKSCFFDEKIIISRNWKKSDEFVQEVNRRFRVFHVNNKMRASGKHPNSRK